MSSGYLSSLLPAIEAEFAINLKRSDHLHNPTLWAFDHLGITLSPKQVEVANAIANGPVKSVAVRAGHGVGKSHLAGILTAWWIDVHPIESVLVATTAPSADQVSGILWREIRANWELSAKRYAEFLRLKEAGQPTGNLPDHRLPGRVTGDNKIKTDSGRLIATGRKPPDYNEDAFQGLHGEWVLSIGDEACGLNENMIDSLANITSNANSRRLLIGNPTSPRSRFGDIFLKPTGAWSLHHISVLSSPNFHGGGRCDCLEHANQPLGLGLPKNALDSLTDQSYVDEKILEYGQDSARYKARVLGEFAWDEGNNLFTDVIIAKAKNASCYVDYNAKNRVALGMDVARSEHGDTSFLYSYIPGEMRDVNDESGVPLSTIKGAGGKLRVVDKWRGVPLVDTLTAEGKFVAGQATLVHQHAVNLNAREVRVDSGGMGVGLIDGLRMLAEGRYTVVEMQSGGVTPDKRSWINNRAFQYSEMARRMGLGEIDIDPEDKVLVEQLEDILYEFVDPHGAMKIESKDIARRRGVKSPDAADAAWYACADVTAAYGPQPGDVVAIDPWANRSRVGMPI